MHPAGNTSQNVASSFGGLGGIPGNVGPRTSTLALGNDPRTGWSTRHDNRAVQELHVPPEVIAAVTELKQDLNSFIVKIMQMKNHKAMMLEINRTPEPDIEGVAEQIEEVRMGITNLVNVMHKQELLSASLIRDMQELSKDMDLLSQTKDVPSYGYGSTTTMLYNFLYDLIEKYRARMAKYKVEIERAETSIQTIMAFRISNTDFTIALNNHKDTVILLAARVQQIHEDLWNEIYVHKNISEVLFGTAAKPWLAAALAGSSEGNQSAPPLERVLSSTSKLVATGQNIENMYHRTYSMLSRGQALDSRNILSTVAEAHFRSPGYGSTSFHPSSLLGSYMGPSSPAAAASLKRSKK